MQKGIHKTNRLCHGSVDHPKEVTDFKAESDFMTHRRRPAFGAIVFVIIALLVGGYFTFAAVQGDYGLFRRAEIEAQERALETRLSALEAQVTEIENLTKRLSDSYLDLDLLDQQARDVLGMIRADEIVIR